MDAPSVVEPLPRPRPLTAEEARLAGALADAAGPELVAQVAAASVVGVCRCGCSSVRLTTSAPPVPETWSAARSPRGRADHLAVTATGRRAAATTTTATVTLHVLDGRVAELELFDPELGEGHPVDPGGISVLEEVHVE